MSTIGQGGKEGLVLGLWFSMLSVTAFIRVILAINGFHKTPELHLLFQWLPTILWSLAGLFLYLTWRYYNRALLEIKK